MWLARLRRYGSIATLFILSAGCGSPDALSINTPAANQPDIGAFGERFAEVFNDPRFYEPDYCQTNIWRLTGVLKESDGEQSLDAAWVYFLLPEREPLILDAAQTQPRDDGDLIFPIHARGSVGSWAYHVVLEFARRIWDFDFTNEPRATFRDDYFRDMFSPQEIARMRIRAIPAREYNAEYDEASEKNVFYYTSSDNPRYPLRRLEDLFKTVSRRTRL